MSVNLSILIPTHNRQRYAIPTVEALLANLPYSEIVVCDTSEEDLLSNKLRRWNEIGTVKLVRPNAQVQMTVVDNFREALKHATGKYLIFIGDDDFVDARAESIAHWASNRGVDAVRCTFPVSYYWPDFSSRYFGSGYASKLAIKPFDCSIREFDSKAEYRAALRNLGGGVQNMPRAYLGMISREIALRICTKYGSIFGGVSPDIYSAALISNEASSCVEIDFPFIVPGSSGASTSGQSAKGAHKGRLRQNAHIGPFVDLVWDERIPEFYSVPTVWSFSLLKAAEKILDDTSANLGRLYAKCLLTHPEYAAETWRAMQAQSRRVGWPVLLWTTTRGIVVETWSQLARIMRRLSSGRSATAGAQTIEGVADCSQASIALSNYIGSKYSPGMFPWSHCGAAKSVSA